MLSEKIRKLRHSLAFRLTLSYAGIFTVSWLVAFIALYYSISTITLRHTDQEFTNEIAEFSSLLSARGLSAVKTIIKLEAESDGVEKIFIRLLTPEGKELASSNMASWKDISVSKIALRQLGDGAPRIFETLALPNRRYSVRVAYAAIASKTIIQIGQTREDDEELLDIVQTIFLITLPILIVVAAFIGWFMARRALRGVEEITRTATAITNGALDLRVPMKTSRDEIDQLAMTFNHMLDRIHTLVAGMRDMTDSIAHDLRSPITRIRGIAEMTLTGSGSRDEYTAMAADTIEECDRLLGMIDTMLDIAEFEAGIGGLRMEKVDFSAVVREAYELFLPVAEDKRITFTADVTSGCSVQGDIQRLQRMVANLLDNALKYTPSQGTVTVAVRTMESNIILSVSDTGIGISPTDLPHIFKRFYRCDQSRSQTGSGLGLSLAQAITTVHGGSITVSSSLGKGSTFTVTLPQHTILS